MAKFILAVLCDAILAVCVVCGLGLMFPQLGMHLTWSTWAGALLVLQFRSGMGAA